MGNVPVDWDIFQCVCDEKMTFIILALATWRISSLLVNEAGLWEVFFRIRKLAGIEHDENGKVWIVPERFFAQLLSCVWCASLWVGVGWTVAWWWNPRAAELAALPFALSAGAIVVECAVDALKR